MTVHQYIVNNLINLDKLGNTLIGGDPDETISARSGRLRDKYPRSWGLLARWLDWIQVAHASRAMEHDLERAQRIEAIEVAAQRADDELIERETRVKE